MEKYTGKKVGIIADPHGLLEPTVAAIIDMKRKGIEEIYSLGDNIGVGPNPSEVLDVLEYYGVKSIAGNSEYYVSLGIEPFSSYFNELKKQSHLWTLSKLNEKQIGKIELLPSWIELQLGGKRIALCHFANDVRIDFIINSTWSYQNKIDDNKPGFNQFLYTNSESQKKYIEDKLSKEIKPETKGFISAKKYPLFNGEKADKFDAIIQGHVHWKLYEESKSTRFYSIRAVGMAYRNDPKDMSSYVVLKEKKLGGFDFEEVLVPYDRKKMLESIIKSDSPDQTIRKFTM